MSGEAEMAAAGKSDPAPRESKRRRLSRDIQYSRRVTPAICASYMIMVFHPLPAAKLKERAAAEVRV
jgi:hypothetical protein